MAEINDTAERWLPIIGWEGRYAVSDSGRVKSLARTVIQRTGRCHPVPETVLVGRIGKDGYRYVLLYGRGPKKTIKVHRLVATAFVDGSGSVDHINADRLDNRASNLRFCTPAENSANMRRLGRQARGEKNSHAKLTAADVAEIRRIYAAGGVSQPTLAKRYGVTHPMIGFIVRREAWVHVK